MDVDTDRYIFLSLKPRFATAILSGIKTIELRRTRPRIAVPTNALLYASSPTMALVGTCRVDKVVSGDVDSLWHRFGGETALSRAEYDDYFHDRELGYGLTLSEVQSLDQPIDLRELRSRWSNFQPPQSFRYLPFEAGSDVLQLVS